jgi:hypothetical protein
MSNVVLVSRTATTKERPMAQHTTTRRTAPTEPRFGYPKAGSKWGTARVVAVQDGAITVQDGAHTLTLTYLQFSARYL